MTQATFTETDVGRILAAALERFARESISQPRLYSLDEVADLTGINARWIKDECRAERLTHVRRDRTRGMTAAQIDDLLARYTVHGETTDAVAPSQAALTAVQMSRRNASRSAKRRAA